MTQVGQAALAFAITKAVTPDHSPKITLDKPLVNVHTLYVKRVRVANKVNRVLWDAGSLRVKRDGMTATLQVLKGELR